MTPGVFIVQFSALWDATDHFTSDSNEKFNLSKMSENLLINCLKNSCCFCLELST